MFVVSPAAILYDQAGNPVAISPNAAIPVGTSTILVAGTDGTDARIFSVDSTGKLAIQNPSNLDVALSTRASSAAQTDGSQKTQVVNGANTLAVNVSGQAAIQNPPNLDATLTSRFGPLGQALMAASAPVVIASNQSTLNQNVAQWIGSTSPSVGQKTMAASIPVVISSDQTAIPVGVTGIVDSGQMYSAGVSLNMATAGTDNPLLLLQNPSGSGKKVRIFFIYTGISTTNRAATFELYASPTVTSAGSAVTVVNRNIGGAGSASAVLTSLPTVSSAGTKFSSFVVGQNTTSINLSQEFSLTLQPNTYMLITGDPSSNTTEAVLSLSWREEPV